MSICLCGLSLCVLCLSVRLSVCLCILISVLVTIKRVHIKLFIQLYLLVHVCETWQVLLDVCSELNIATR